MNPGAMVALAERVACCLLVAAYAFGCGASLAYYWSS